MFHITEFCFCPWRRFSRRPLPGSKCLVVLKLSQKWLEIKQNAVNDVTCQTQLDDEVRDTHTRVTMCTMTSLKSNAWRWAIPGYMVVPNVIEVTVTVFFLNALATTVSFDGYKHTKNEGSSSYLLGSAPRPRHPHPTPNRTCVPCYRQKKLENSATCCDASHGRYSGMIRDSIAKLGGGALHFLAANRINVYVGLSKLVKRTQLLLVDECFII